MIPELFELLGNTQPSTNEDQPSTSMILIDPAEISTTDPLLSHDHDDPILLEPFPVIDPASE